MQYQIGDELIHIETGIKGVVVENCKLPGDICVQWETGFFSSYDEDFLEEIAIRKVNCTKDR